MANSKYHPDNVFLISGYRGTPDALDAKFVIAPNKSLATSTVTDKESEFVPISVVSLSEMRQIVDSMENAAQGNNPYVIVNEMFA